MKITKDNELEDKIVSELNRVEEELLEEMFQQFYLSGLEKDIQNKANKLI
jgi:hypothetical protein